MSDRLITTGDVGEVCRSEGLRQIDAHPLDPPIWLDADVTVKIVNGYVGWQVSWRDGIGGLLVCEAGPSTQSRELLRLAIAEARRIADEEYQPSRTAS